MPPEAVRQVRRVLGHGRRAVRRAGARVATFGVQPVLGPERAASEHPPSFEQLVCQAASAAQADDPRYRDWMAELGEPVEVTYHRKVWEKCFIMEAFRQSGLLVPGNRAVGFAVGREAIPAVLAARGLHVVGTDQPAESAGDWADSGQHAGGVSELRHDEICPSERFEELVSYRPVDMNHLPDDLRGFDLLWSSCAFEHLGRPGRGTGFVVKSLACLRPGGVGVHTTELRVHGRDDLDLGGIVLYARDTMARLVARLRLRGHHVQANLYVAWGTEADDFIDVPPYVERPYHLKLRVGGEIATSFGLIVTKRGG